MTANHYFIDLVNVIIDSTSTEVVIITGSGFYEPNRVKKMAIEMISGVYPNGKLAAVILSHKNVTLEEFQAEIGSNPRWLGNL